MLNTRNTVIMYVCSVHTLCGICDSVHYAYVVLQSVTVAVQSACQLDFVWINAPQPFDLNLSIECNFMSDTVDGDEVNDS